MTWQLRRANATDLEGIMLLESSIFGTDAWSADTMLAELESRNTWYLVAFRPETPEHLDAYAGLLSPKGASTAEIQTIAVTQKARRTGLGKTMMRTLINEATARGAGEVMLEVRADNPGAEELYRSLGFERIAIRRTYYQPDGVDAHVMRLVPTPREPALAAKDDGSERQADGAQAAAPTGEEAS